MAELVGVVIAALVGDLLTAVYYRDVMRCGVGVVCEQFVD
jgi:hypothetical protein